MKKIIMFLILMLFLTSCYEKQPTVIEVTRIVEVSVVATEEPIREKFEIKLFELHKKNGEIIYTCADQVHISVGYFTSDFYFYIDGKYVGKIEKIKDYFFYPSGDINQCLNRIDEIK